MQPSRRTQHGHDEANVQHAAAQALAGNAAIAVEGDLEGGKRADGAAKGRVTGQHGSLTVNNGQSKAGADLGHNALIRHDARQASGVRFPQLHDGALVEMRVSHS